MKIKNLSISNFRGIRSLSLKLNDSLNVFLGMNGAGKSTLIDALAIMLSWVVSRIKYGAGSGRHIPEKDITNKEGASSIELSYMYKGESVSWRLVKGRKGYGAGNGKSDLKAVNSYAKDLQDRISISGEKTNIPVFIYYPVHRAVMDIPLRIRKKYRFNLLAALEDSLTGGANFRTFFEWFREREDLENENLKIRNSLVKEGLVQEGPIYPDLQLEAVRKAVSLMLPEFTGLTVRRNPLRMEIRKQNETLTIDQLSDGEKCLLSMVGDLARRMAIANPMRGNPLHGEGIVLIDEIDLHLHPKWQRMVVPRLLEIFPNCQFFITTHSPHVITHVKAENIFCLEMTEQGITAAKPYESYGKNVDRVLEDLMGLETTRPDRVASMLRDIYERIGEGDLDDAKEKIRALEKEIGNDPELVKANVLIRRRELIGK